MLSVPATTSAPLFKTMPPALTVVEDEIVTVRPRVIVMTADVVASGGVTPPDQVAGLVQSPLETAV